MPMLAMLLLALLQFAMLLPGNYAIGTDSLRAADAPAHAVSALHHADGYRLEPAGQPDHASPDLLPPLPAAQFLAGVVAEPVCSHLAPPAGRRHVSLYLACGPPALPV